MRIPPFIVIVVLCGSVIAATQLAAERPGATEQIAPGSQPGRTSGISTLT